MSTDSSVLSGSIKVFSSKILVLLLSAAAVLFLARALGADGRGLLAAILVFPNLMVALAEGGMRQSAIRFIGSKTAPEGKILFVLLVYMACAGIVGFLVVSLSLTYASPLNISLPIVLVASFIVPATLGINALHGYFLGRQDVSNFSKILWVQKLFYLLSISILYFFDMLSLLTAVASMALAVTLNLVQALWYLLPTVKDKLAFDAKLLWSMLKIGWAYAIALFLIQANYKIDVLFLSYLSGSAETGNYAVAIQIGELLWQLPGAVLLVVMAKAANESSSMVDEIAKTVRVTLFATIILAVGLVSAVCLGAEFVLGNDFALVPKVFLMLLPGLVLATIFKTLNGYFAGKGKPQITIKIMGVSVIINIIFNLILIPGLGGVGAAIASTISYAFSAFLYLNLFCRLENVRWSNVLIAKRNDFVPIFCLFRRLNR